MKFVLQHSAKSLLYTILSADDSFNLYIRVPQDVALRLHLFVSLIWWHDLGDWEVTGENSVSILCCLSVSLFSVSLGH